MKQTKRKSLTLAEAFPAVSAIALVGIVIVTLIYMFSSLQTGIGSTYSQTTNAETIAAVSTIGVYTANASDCNFGNWVVTSARNATDGILINAANYTYTPTGLIRYTGKYSIFNNTNWVVNSTWTNGGAACVATGTSGTQFISIIPMVGLVLVIVLIGIVIGVLIYSFVGSRQKA